MLSWRALADGPGHRPFELVVADRVAEIDSVLGILAGGFTYALPCRGSVDCAPSEEVSALHPIDPPPNSLSSIVAGPTFRLDFEVGLASINPTAPVGEHPPIPLVSTARSECNGRSSSRGD